ncbi:GtrA family protein [Bacteroides sp. 224]|uniref:GtrA family protein n=1 Tax=Bacteroides sp. 224 TaxID=2302936 RepID=UPI0013D01F4E|nr:GtrA family protein [Bacteroides sp. 224]NDV64457.1 GtrA family protein [Bacteroides sp. 224]
MNIFLKKVNTEIIRFICVGIINTLFGVGLYCLFIYLGLSYKFSVLLSTILGVLFNFKTIGTFVFKNKENKLIFKFIISYTITYFINIGLIRILLMFEGTNEYTAGIFSTPIVAIISYIIQKNFVFKKA